MECELHGNRLRVYNNGTIEKCKDGKWVVIKQSTSTNGYKRFGLRHLGKHKVYSVHRVVAFVYLFLNIDNPKIFIDHINNDKTDNNINNLRLSDAHKNQWNRKNAGCYYISSSKKWKAQICVYRKIKHIGCFDTEAEAHKAYLKVKLLYHIQ